MSAQLLELCAFERLPFSKAQERLAAAFQARKVLEVAQRLKAGLPVVVAMRCYRGATNSSIKYTNSKVQERLAEVGALHALPNHMHNDKSAETSVKISHLLF